MLIKENVSLAPHTTLKIGGPARYFAEITTEAKLLHALTFARNQSLPIFVLGGGSNLLVSDDGYAGLTLKVALTGRLLSGLKGRSATVQYSVPAGHDWNDFVKVTCKARLAGMECLAGIPGTVGASPVQNIGAYGQEVARTITSVRAYDLQVGDFVELPAEVCQFAYRSSIFNSSEHNRYVITRVNFEFDLDAPVKLAYADLKRHFANHPNPTPLEVYHVVREIRAAKGMLIDPANPTPDSTSAGSFFKNPVVPLAALDRIARRLNIAKDEVQHWPVTAHPEAADPGGTVMQQSPGETKLPAAWLIERAGFAKGYTLGPVGISTKHTLALTNRTGTATCADLLALRDQIVAGVEEAFGITLEQEPVYLS